MNDLKNFNEIITKDMPYYSIKNHEKPGFHPFFRRYIFQKMTRVGAKLTPHSGFVVKTSSKNVNFPSQKKYV